MENSRIKDSKVNTPDEPLKRGFYQSSNVNLGKVFEQKLTKLGVSKTTLKETFESLEKAISEGDWNSVKELSARAKRIASNFSSYDLPVVETKEEVLKSHIAWAEENFSTELVQALTTKFRKDFLQLRIQNEDQITETARLQNEVAYRARAILIVGSLRGNSDCTELLRKWFDVEVRREI